MRISLTLLLLTVVTMGAATARADAILAWDFGALVGNEASADATTPTAPACSEPSRKPAAEPASAAASPATSSATASRPTCSPPAPWGSQPWPWAPYWPIWPVRRRWSSSHSVP